MLLILLSLLSPTAQADVGEELSARLDHYSRAFYRAEARLRDFDQELDAAVAAGNSDFLQNSTSYQELQALRDIMHGDAEMLLNQYEELEADDAPEARTALANFQRELGDLEGGAQLAAADLLQHMRSHDHGVETLEAALPSFNKPTETAFARIRNQRDLDLRVEESRALSDIDLDIAEYNSDQAEAEEARVENISLQRGNVVYPSPGTAGNLTGANFPRNTWALTFDDGPSAKFTRPIVQMLQAHGKKATFFWLAKNVSANRSVISLAEAAGMPLNNHSYSHRDLSKASYDQLKYEIADSTALEARLYSQRPEFFRLPYGAGVRDATVRKMIADQNLIHVFWNVDSLDWKDKDAYSVFERVKKQMQLQKRGIILFHDIHSQSVQASKMVLDYSDTLDGTSNRLRWVTLPQIVKELNQ